MPAAALGVACALGCQLLYEKNDLTVAAGGGSSTSDGGTGGTTPTTSSGGMGGGATGGGGAGGAAAGGGGAGGATTTSTADCSDERIFVFGTGANGVVCATFSPASGWDVTATMAGSSNERPAAALLNAQRGLAVFYQGDANDDLRAVEWTRGACSAPADVPGITTKAGPAATAHAGKVHVLFQGAVGAGTDHPFHLPWDPVIGWGPTSQVGNAASFAVAGLAGSGEELLAVQGRASDSAVVRTRQVGAAWGADDCLKNEEGMCELTKNTLTPGVAALEEGGWLVVFHDFSNAELRWLTTDGAVNAPSKTFGMAAAPTPVALSRTRAGAPVLAFRGADDKVYTSVYEAGAWGPILEVPGATTQASPAVAPGVCAHEAELVLVDPAGTIRHASLEAGAWSAPAVVAAAGMKHVAVASAP